MAEDEKRERLLEAATAILRAAPDNSLKVVLLNKALFYLDLAFLRDQGKTVTCNTYIALENGPVVAKYQSRLVKSLEDEGIAIQQSEWDGSKPLVLIPDQPPHAFRFLDDEALQLIQRITAFFANKTSTEASRYSHENPGWEMAWREQVHSKKAVPIDMNMALQQIVEEDPWLYEPLVNDEELLQAADMSEGEDW